MNWSRILDVYRPAFESTRGKDSIERIAIHASRVAVVTAIIAAFAVVSAALALVLFIVRVGTP